MGFSRCTQTVKKKFSWAKKIIYLIPTSVWLKEAINMTSDDPRWYRWLNAVTKGLILLFLIIFKYWLIIYGIIISETLFILFRDHKSYVQCFHFVWHWLFTEKKSNTLRSFYENNRITFCLKRKYWWGIKTTATR